MEDQPVTRTEFDGLNAAAKAMLDQLTALTAKIEQHQQQLQLQQQKQSKQ
jgi:prefoldin subunit 5